MLLSKSNININQKINDVTLSWLGTPFINQGRKRKQGCDCVGLIIGVANDLNLTAKNGIPIIFYDQPHYHYLRDRFKLKSYLEKLFEESSQMRTGNIIAFFQNNICIHIGIICTYQGKKIIVHASMESGKVVANSLLSMTKSYLYRIYKFGK